MSSTFVRGDENHAKVLDILTKNGSMAFLDLVSRCEIDEPQVRRIVDDLENQKLVTLAGRGNVLTEIVSPTARTAARSVRASA